MSLSLTAAAASGRTRCVKRHVSFGGCRIFPRLRRSVRLPAQRAGMAKRPRLRGASFRSLRKYARSSTIFRSGTAWSNTMPFCKTINRSCLSIFVSRSRLNVFGRRWANSAGQCWFAVRRWSARAARSATARMITWRRMIMTEYSSMTDRWRNCLKKSIGS